MNDKLKAIFAFLRDCRVCALLDTGSDHRAVVAELDLAAENSRKNRFKKTSGNDWSVHEGHYKKELDSILDNRCPNKADVDMQQAAVEHAMLEAAERSKKTVATAPVVTDEIDIEIRNLISERRRVQESALLPTDEKDAKRRTICKQIQGLVRKRSRAQKQLKIQRILAEFRGSKQIAAIKEFLKS